MDELEKIRNEIKAVDERILEALVVHRKLVSRVVQAKDQHGAPIRDALREEQLLPTLIGKGRSQGLDAHFVTRVFHEIIDDSIRSQQLHLLGDSDKPNLKRVAFQGIEGAFSELAGRKFFARTLDHTAFVGFPTFDEVVEAVEDGDADYGRNAAGGTPDRKLETGRGTARSPIRADEVPDTRSLLSQVCSCLKSHARFLVVEPRLHVSAEAFQGMLTLAREVGLGVLEEPHVRLSRAVVFGRR